MRKIIVTILLAALLCAIVCTTALAWQLERCPFCGAEEAFLRYGEDYGACTKCGQDTRRFDLTVNIKSCGSEDETIEASLYQYGKRLRLNQVQGTDTFASFISVQHGVYTLVVTKAGHTAYSRTVWLTGDTVLDVHLSPVFCRPAYFRPFGCGWGTMYAAPAMRFPL